MSGAISVDGILKLSSSVEVIALIVVCGTGQSKSSPRNEGYPYGDELLKKYVQNLKFLASGS